MEKEKVIEPCELLFDMDERISGEISRLQKDLLKNVRKINKSIFVIYFILFYHCSKSVLI